MNEAIDWKLDSYKQYLQGIVRDTHKADDVTVSVDMSQAGFTFRTIVCISSPCFCLEIAEHNYLDPLSRPNFGNNFGGRNEREWVNMFFLLKEEVDSLFGSWYWEVVQDYISRLQIGHPAKVHLNYYHSAAKETLNGEIVIPPSYLLFGSGWPQGSLVKIPYVDLSNPNLYTIQADFSMRLHKTPINNFFKGVAYTLEAEQDGIKQ